LQHYAYLQGEQPVFNASCVPIAAFMAPRPFCLGGGSRPHQSAARIERSQGIATAGQ
jgi:hypothetical protein